MLPTMWLTKFKALEEFWRNPENSFKVPRQYSDNTSGLNYKFFSTYVINIDKVKNEKKLILLKKAISAARAKTTISANKLLKNIVENKCTYQKTTLLSSKCRKTISKANSSDKRCIHHQKLTVQDLLKKGTYQLVSERQRDYKSTVYIKNSTILNAGRGVFSTKHFCPGELITGYGFSKIITAEETSSLKGTREYAYVLSCGDRTKCFVGLTEPQIGQGLGSFINSPDHKSSNQKKANCKAKYDKNLNIIYIVATEHIWKHSELFMTYNRGKLVCFL